MKYHHLDVWPWGYLSFWGLLNLWAVQSTSPISGSMPEWLYSTKSVEWGWTSTEVAELEGSSYQNLSGVYFTAGLQTSRRRGPGYGLRGQGQRKTWFLWSASRDRSNPQSTVLKVHVAQNLGIHLLRIPGPGMGPLGAQSYQRTYSQPVSANFSADSLQEPVLLPSGKPETTIPWRLGWVCRWLLGAQ